MIFVLNISVSLKTFAVDMYQAYGQFLLSELTLNAEKSLGYRIKS
jgi:hypothetical protein